MRPRVRSYGDNSTRTRSPGRIRMKFIRSLPLMWASTRWPFSSSTANIVLGSGSMTVPSTSIASRLATGYVLPFLTGSAGPDGPTHERIAYQKSRFPARRKSSDRCQDFRTVLGHGDRVLEVGGERTVDGGDRPVIGEDMGAVVTQREHGLDGEAESRFELATLAAGAVVGDLRLLVHLGADAVANELADHAEAVRPGDLFDRRR